MKVSCLGTSICLGATTAAVVAGAWIMQASASSGPIGSGDRTGHRDPSKAEAGSLCREDYIASRPLSGMDCFSTDLQWDELLPRKTFPMILNFNPANPG